MVMEAIPPNLWDMWKFLNHSAAMFNSYSRKLKPVCEACGRTPHAPRRRCPHCNLLVCVSNCWIKKIGHCNNCAGKLFTDLIKTENFKNQPPRSENNSRINTIHSYQKFKHKNGCKNCGSSINTNDPNYSSTQTSKQNFCKYCHTQIYGWY